MYCLKCEVEVASLGVHSPAAGAHPPLKRCFQEHSNAFPVSLLSTPVPVPAMLELDSEFPTLHPCPDISIFSHPCPYFMFLHKHVQTYTCINLMNISLNLGKEPTLKAVNTLEVLTLPHPEISPL